MITPEIAVDFGSANIRIYVKGFGLALIEPSTVAVSGDEKNYKLVGIGKDAEKLRGRTDDKTYIFNPVVNGIVKNIEYAGLLLSGFLDKIGYKKVFRKNYVVLPLNDSITDQERQDFIDAFRLAGLPNILPVHKSLCSLIGMGLDPFQSEAQCVVDVGAGSVNIAVISSGKIIKGCTTLFGGRNVDAVIANDIQNVYGVNLPLRSAQEVKEHISSLFVSDNQSLESVGLDLSTNQPTSVVIYANTLYTGVMNFFADIVKIIQTTINTCSPEIAKDIAERGVYICGGMSRVPGLENYLRKNINLDVFIYAENDACILGAGKLIKEQSKFSKLLH